MPLYQVTIVHDACTTHEIEADSPKEAADKAMGEVSNVSLCHQCSHEIDLADPVRVVCVYNEETDENHTDLDPPIEAVSLQRKLDEVTAERDALQAEVDRLMLEFCPDEMTAMQVASWEEHQVAAMSGDKS